MLIKGDDALYHLIRFIQMKYPVEIDENLYEKRINVAFVTPAGEELDFDPNNQDDVEEYIPPNEKPGLSRAFSLMFYYSQCFYCLC